MVRGGNGQRRRSAVERSRDITARRAEISRADRAQEVGTVQFLEFSFSAMPKCIGSCPECRHAQDTDVGPAAELAHSKAGTVRLASKRFVAAMACRQASINRRFPVHGRRGTL